MAAFDRTDVKELAIGIGTKASAVTSAQLLAPELGDPVVWPVVRLRRRGLRGLSRGLTAFAFALLARLF